MKTLVPRRGIVAQIAYIRFDDSRRRDEKRESQGRWAKPCLDIRRHLPTTVNNHWRFCFLVDGIVIKFKFGKCTNSKSPSFAVNAFE